MTILAFAEHRDGKFKKSSFETVRAARGVADALNAECCALVVGSNITTLAKELGAYGASRVIAVDDPSLAAHASLAFAKVIAAVAKQQGADMVFLPASQMGKDLAPRIAVKLEAGLASDCVSLNVENGELIATRPVYAGKALVDVRVTTPVKVYTLRPNVFTATSGRR